VERFRERPSERIVPDAWRFAAVPTAGAVLCGLLGWGVAGWLLAGLAVFVVAFFRNPDRGLSPDPRCVVSPADGWVLDVSEIEEADGAKALRIAIFLTVFDVHVNRMPIGGRVMDIERTGSRFLAAMNPDAESDNVRCTLTLETEQGLRFRVTQITGLIARRIVCHPQVGQWVDRGLRFGLIRFGSRTDVVLPVAAVPLVAKGARVLGGSTAIAWLEQGA
jgi:phosphatidylserine decarboxylase